MVRCSIRGCTRNAKADLGISFFRFPAETIRCNEWLRALGRPDLEGINADFMHLSKYRVCSVHFHSNSFSSMLMNRLKRDAVPVLFPPAAGKGPFFGTEGGDDLRAELMSMSAKKSQTDSVNKDGANTNGEVEKPSQTETVEKEQPSQIEHIDLVETTENGIESSNEVENVIESESSNMQSQEDENEDDDDFNPLLLCPDISMDVDESPVVTTSAAESEAVSAANDLLDSNSLFAPLFSTFVDEMTGAEISFNLTSEEQQLREKLYGPNNPIQYSKVHCTACNVHLGSALAGQTNRFVHPLLKVLICKECYHFYTSGEFEKDEDGSELYCRWCGQGGQVLCCTMCEFVFCKKCIRINFGRRKLTQVRDSDDWKCFRCDVSQLKTLRAMCVEFFEYVRRETARAATLNDPDFMNRDLTNCCQAQAKKRQVEVEKEVEKDVSKKVKKRKNEEEDPDYNPYRPEQEEEENKPMSPVPSTSGVVVNTPKLPSVVPKPTVVTPSTIIFPGKTPSPTVRIGNAIMNIKSGPTGTHQVSNIGSPVIKPINMGVRSPSTFGATRPRQTFTSKTPSLTVNPRTPSMPALILTGNRPITPKPLPPTNNTPVMKHEWFEKTVRAAARVNSNLSYTLTQLNKAQANASSVEQLAVVHNKLQEILSSSINSLIQIRKNLRTEFIAGIKTIRFPPKKPVDPNDDDVIIVNPTPVTNTTKNMLSGLPHISLMKNSPNKVVNNITTTPTVCSSNTSSTTTPTVSTPVPPRCYLKVKSFSQLQTVTSECITIPDDDPPQMSKNDDPIIVGENMMPEMEKDPLAVDLDPEDTPVSMGTIIVENCNNETNKDSTEKEKDENSEQNSKKPNESETISIDNSDKHITNGEGNGENCDANKKSSDSDVAIISENSSELCNGTSDEQVSVKQETEEIRESYNVKEKPSPKIRRMLSVKVNLKKTPTVEELVKKEPIEIGSE